MSVSASEADDVIGAAMRRIVARSMERQRRQRGSSFPTTTTTLLQPTYQYNAHQFYPPREDGFSYAEGYYGYHDSYGGFGGILPFLAYLIKTVVLWSVLFVLSLGSYLLFYQFAMPSLVASENIYFDYSVSCLSPQPRGLPLNMRHFWSNTYDTLSVTPTTHVCDATHSPHASVDLFTRKVAWEAMHETIVPQPKASHRLLTPRQAYFIEIELQLPDSEINRRAGMFSLTAELRSTNGTQLASSNRSVRYPHQTPWITTIRKLVWLAPILVGAVDESTPVTVTPFRHYTESFELPLQDIRLQLTPGPSSHHPLSGTVADVVEVIAGEVRIGEELSWFQELLKEWFFTGVILGTHVFAILYIVQLHILQFVCHVIRSKLGYDDQEEPPCELNLDGSFGDVADAVNTGRQDNSPRNENASTDARFDPTSRCSTTNIVEDDEEDWEELDGNRTDDFSFSTPPQGGS